MALVIKAAVVLLGAKMMLACFHSLVAATAAFRFTGHA
jgi:hypothetical protein